MIFTECPIHRGLATLGHAEKGVKNEFRNGTFWRGIYRALSTRTLLASPSTFA